MFSSWDLVRPRFWYPMSFLEQSMMELDHMSDMMMRPRFPLDMRREVLKGPKYAEEDSDDDDFFVDLPVLAPKYKPDEALQLAGISSEKEVAQDNHGGSDTDSSTDMDVDDEGNNERTKFKTKTKLASNEEEMKVEKGKRRNKTPKKQHRKHSYKVTPTAERKSKTKTDGDGHTFSSYSFSSSSVVDNEGRRVTTMRRRYEDSTGRLKAVHEREIDGKKMKTTWDRQNKGDEGKHESICSSGSPEDFEVLWQQTPFGEAQKKTVKGQLQSESDVERDVASTAATLENPTLTKEPSEKKSSTKNASADTSSENFSTKKNSGNVEGDKEDK